MHPKNIYITPPDFKELSISYPEFRKFVTQDITGRISINFKDPNALRALTKALLHRDFDLNVEIPNDNLVPTVPQRLNYILWVEDLIKLLPDKEEQIQIIDIGTGSSCIFPLLGSRKFGWNFLASESNSKAVESANNNIKNNNLSENIKVVQVERDSLLVELLKETERNYDLSMCNPPFYSDNAEASGEKNNRTKKRSASKSSNSANKDEKIIEGGEVAFAKKMINDSLILKSRISLYTTMLGKKSSVKLLKEELKQLKITEFVVTEFSQGKTMRWGLAWTFLNNISLKNVESLKATKPVPPLSYFIPSNIQITQYSINEISKLLIELLNELKFQKSVIIQNELLLSIEIKAENNTWSHQRRKKRAAKRCDDEHPPAECSTPKTVSHKRKCEELINSNEISNNNNTVKECLFDGFLRLKLVGNNIILEIESVTITNKDILHQIMQFFKNKLK